MKVKNRLLANYRRGGLSAVADSIRDFLHYDITQSYTNHRQVVEVTEFWDSNADGYIPVQLPGYRLYLDPEDPGISRDILSRGIREWPSYYHYRRVLHELSDGPLTLEAGSNIGYYALAAAVERPDGRVLCAELDQENVKRCQYNVEQNGLGDRVTVEQATLSDSTGTATATVADESNLHSLYKTGSETRTVETITGEQFLAGHGFETSDVDVLRMDVDGAELRILRGLPGLQPRVAHVEVHPERLDREQWTTLCDIFQQWDAEIVGVYKENKEFDVRSVSEIPVNKATQVVFADGK